MKKVLSLVLAVIMALTAVAPISAFAWGDTAYDRYINSMGKKGGEILGAYEGVRVIVSKNNLQGFEEVIALNNQSEATFRAAMKEEKEAYFAYGEVEKAKIEAAGINAEASEEFGTGIIEGFGSRIGDPSSCARNIDIIVADYKGADSDLKDAIEYYNKAKSGNVKPPDTVQSLMRKCSECASRAFLEYSGAEETYYKNYLMFKDSWDYVVAENEPLFELRERALKLVEKANSDVEKNHKCLDKAREELTAAGDLAASAYEKAVILFNNASAEERPCCERIKDYLWELGAGVNGYGVPNNELNTALLKIDNMDPAEFNVDLSGAVDMVERLTAYGLFELRKKQLPSLLSKFYLTANELTYNGKEQPLVRFGETVIIPEDAEFSKVKFALGSAPDYVLNEVVYCGFGVKSHAPDDSEFTEKLPTAKEPGTYYVYAKFPDGTNMVAKAVINKAKPAPVKPTLPVKKANTLTAKGRTVKAKNNKKTVIKTAKAFTVKNAKGAVTFKKSKGNKKITVAKNGKITVKKGLKKGTYKIKVTVSAAGNNTYKKATKTVSVKIVVK